MRKFAMSVVVAACAGTMTAIPASAQTVEGRMTYGPPVVERTVVETRYFSEDGSTYAVLDEQNQVWMVFDAEDDRFLRTTPLDAFLPGGREGVTVETDRELRLSAYGAQRAAVAAGQPVEEDRYYDPERQTYAVFEPVKRVWNVFDAATDALIDTFAEDEYEPYEPGHARVTFRAHDEPERGAFARMDLRPGIAEERYYDAGRRTYAVFDPVRSEWNVFDAATGELTEVFSQGAYQPYEPGYTVSIPRTAQPGLPQVGMGVEGESIAADQTPISDNRE